VVHTPLLLHSPWLQLPQVWFGKHTDEAPQSAVVRHPQTRLLKQKGLVGTFTQRSASASLAAASTHWPPSQQPFLQG